jgi:exonuclease III
LGKLASWNINSLTVRLPHLLDWLRDNPVDVIALHETKLTDDHVPVSTALKPTPRGCTVDNSPRKRERPSDHAPVVVELDWTAPCAGVGT